jgi:molybdopterin molybdotransferase
MTSLKEAISLIEEHLKPSDAEEVIVEESVGRILAEDVVSPMDFPPAATAAKDGVAVCHKDLLSGEPIRIVGCVLAGESCEVHISSMEGVRISTGGKLPKNTDCVIPEEQIRYHREDLVSSLVSCRRWENVTRAGELIKRGGLLGRGGRMVDAALMTCMGTLGIRSVRVFRRPRVGILNTGTELVRQGFSSHGLYLKARAVQEGAEVTWIKVCADDVGLLCSQLSQEGDVQLIITTGGTGSGHGDVLHSSMRKLGAREIFIGVKIRPGQGTSCYELEDRLILCLPGGGGAMRTSFEVLGVAAIRRLQGLDSGLEEETFECRLTSPVKRDPHCTRLLEARVWAESGQLYCVPVERGPTGCGLIRWDSNGWIVVQSGGGMVEPGSMVSVLIPTSPGTSSISAAGDNAPRREKVA